MSASRAIIRILLVTALVTFIASCGEGSGDSDNGPILIKFPHVTAPATPKGRAAERFRELVAERLAGRVVVEVYPSSQLMNDDDSLDALAFGEIQMIAVSLSKMDRLTSDFQVFDLPFLFADIEAVERFQGSEAGRVLLNSMADKGILGLTYWHNGIKQFGGPVAMRSPADAEGLKFRIMESDVLEAQVLEIGGNPQKMAMGEVYSALQTGAIDAQESTWSNYWSANFYEVQDYLTATNHGYVGYLVAVNPSFWSSLPEDIRTELEAIVHEVAAWGNAISEQINEDARAKIEASGVSEIVSLTDAELAVWREAMQPVWEQFEGQINPDLIAAAISAGQ